MKIFSMGFQVMSSGFHSHDKLGRPAYFENTGRTDIQAMLKVIHIYSLVWLHCMNRQNDLPWSSNNECVMHQLTGLIYRIPDGCG